MYILTDNDKNHINILYGENYTFNMISEELGIPVGTIINHLKEIGLIEENNEYTGDLRKNLINKNNTKALINKRNKQFIFFEPTNPIKWNLLEKVKSLDHIEPFIATQEMQIGDLLLIHISNKDKNIEPGIYAVGEIISNPYIYDKNPSDYCYNTLSVDVKIIKLHKSYPIISMDKEKEIITTFRRANKIDEKHYEKIKQLINNKPLYNKRIVYFRIGWMEKYQGIDTDKIINGGSYNKYNIGHEIYNFKNYNGFYYGYVQTLKSGQIHIEKIGAEAEDESIDNTLLVFIATSPKGGQYIVGWYEKAKLYRNYQSIFEEILKERGTTKNYRYNAVTRNATLLSISDRDFLIEGAGQNNVWYGNKETNDRVFQYIENYKVKQSARGYTNKTRKGETCALCRQNDDDEPIHKINFILNFKEIEENNAKPTIETIKLCKTHRKLFENGLISFNEEGELLISSSLTEEEKSSLSLNNSLSIKLSDNLKKIMKCHQETIFKK